MAAVHTYTDYEEVMAEPMAVARQAMSARRGGGHPSEGYTGREGDMQHFPREPPSCTCPGDAIRTAVAPVGSLNTQSPEPGPTRRAPSFSG